MKTDPSRSETEPASASAGAATAVRDSLTGSIWTFVSRASGLGQSIAVATILGATYLGNTYQAINSLPNIVYYQLLAGSLFASILVPPLVARRDRGDHAGAQRLAQGFYGTLLAAALGVCLLLLLAAPAILHVFALGVADPVVAAAQRRVGLVLFAIFLPQIALYVTAGTGAAVMNAHGRFALAAGAPAVENVGMISTIVLAGLVFGTQTSLANVTMPQILLLGIGTTASVGAHAWVQWLGARGCGTHLVPRAGWRDAEVRRTLRKLVETLGYTGLAASQTLVVLLLANRLAGGLVAFQLALSFFYLPIAIVAWPIARSMLPRLARSTAAADPVSFWDEVTRATKLASFFAAPIAVAYVVLASAIARAVALGQMEVDGGAGLVALSLAALAPGVIGETWFILGTYAFYARQDVRTPLRSMLVRVTTALTLCSFALTTRRPVLLSILGLSLSAGSLVGSAHLWAKLRSTSVGTLPLRSFAGTGAAALIMAVPAGTVAAVLSGWIGADDLGQIAAALGGSIVGLVAYLLVQTSFGAPELRSIRLSAIGLIRGRDG